MNVIVVDDELAPLLTFSSHILDNAEITANMFSSQIDKALEFAKNNLCKAVFLDIVMPSINGVDLAKKFIEDAEKTLGISIMPHIEEISVATPVTFARYLGTPEGTIYGYKLSRWDNLMARTAGEKTDYAIPGLSFCGGHYIRGDGYSCAYIMGETIGKRVAKRIKGGA